MTTLPEASGRPSQFTINQSDNDFLPHPADLQKSDDDDSYINDTASRDFVIEFDRMADWRYMLLHGGLGHFLVEDVGRGLLHTLIFALLFGSSIVFVIANRFIIWGSYLKENYTTQTRLLYMLGLEHSFAYPYTTAWLQLVVAYVSLVLFSTILLWKSTWLESSGLLRIAPVAHIRKSKHDTVERDWKGLIKVQSGFFQQTFSSGLLVSAHIVLTTQSMVRTSMPAFVLARTGLVPLSLFLSMFLFNTRCTKTTLVSCISASIGLALSTFPHGGWFDRGDLTTGIVSSFIMALIPLKMITTYQTLVASSQSGKSQQGVKDVHEKKTSNTLFTQQELLAYLHLSNHTLSLAIALLMPVVTLSGELTSFIENWSALDVRLYWALVLLSGVAGYVGFMTMILLSIATSPLSTTFVFIPLASLVWPIMLGNRLIPQVWLFLVGTWACCIWFLVHRISCTG
jgi:hypothetical protein